MLLYQIQSQGFEKKLKRRAALIKDRAVDYTRHDALKWIEKNLDIETASEIIGEFINGYPKKGFEKLIKLGLPTEPK